MSQLLSLGAINKNTGEYIYPKIANKKDKYICPECDKELILCQGNIKVHHFRHKADNINPCHHYSNPTEAQIHKDAKILLKNLYISNVKVLSLNKLPDNIYEIHKQPIMAYSVSSLGYLSMSTKVLHNKS